ncbi:hypothetical protein [Burkholderia phage vB_BglM_WTB]
MIPYSNDSTQAIKWLQNKAPKLQALINAKADWYSSFNDQFWTEWYTNVFNLDTANTFGLQVWCIILGLPSTQFGLFPVGQSWAYGAARENYVYSGTLPAPAGSSAGGNFFGGSDSTLLNLDEVRFALKLRYAALVGNGRIAYINRMLNWIFNKGQPWDYASKRYVYAADITTFADTPTITAMHKTDYQGRVLLSPSNRTNILSRSDTILGTASTDWIIGPNATQAGTTLAPDGISLAPIYQGTAQSPGNQFVALPFGPVTAGQKYVYSAWFKLVSGPQPTQGSILLLDTLDANGNLQRTGIPFTQVALNGTWQRFQMTFTPGTTTSNNTAYVAVDYGPGTQIATWGAQVESLTADGFAGDLIKTTAGSVTLLDYALQGAQVTTGQPPAIAATLDWDGTWATGSATANVFAVGNGEQTEFTLTAPGFQGGVDVPFRVEYRVGAGMNLSSQFINLLNNEPQFGILPSCAGSKSIVIQES